MVNANELEKNIQKLINDCKAKYNFHKKKHKVNQNTEECNSCRISMIEQSSEIQAYKNILKMVRTIFK